MLLVILAPCVSNLLQLTAFRCTVIFADVAEGSSRVEIPSTHRALDAVFHRQPQISGIDLPFIFCVPWQVMPRSPGLLYHVR